MNKILFLFQNVWNQIIYNKLTSIVMLIAMVIGLFFPLMAMNEVNDTLADEHMTAYNDASHVAVIEYFMKYKEEAEMYAVISSAQEKGLFDEASFNVYESQIIYVGNDNYALGVNGISAEYFRMNAYELLKGEMFSEDDYVGKGEKVCLITQQSSLVKKGVRTGDTIQILGDTYIIKGIIRAPWIYGGILVPYAMSPELFSGTNSQIQYQIITHGENLPNPKILSFKLFSEEPVIIAQTGEEKEKIFAESVIRINHYRILRAATVIGFTIINMFLLLTGMIVRKRDYMAIRMAIGASSAIIGVEVIMGNVYLMFIALFINFLAYPGVAFLLDGSNTYLRIITITEVCAGGLLIVAVTSMLSLHIGLRKQGIALLLKKQM